MCYRQLELIIDSSASKKAATLTTVTDLISPLGDQQYWYQD